GVMIGRSAIRNPWIFRQCRELFGDEPLFTPLLADVRSYIDILWEATSRPGLPEQNQVSRMKKLLNFVGQGVDPEGKYLKAMRRSQTHKELMDICDAFMVNGGLVAQPFAD